jgi:hypothetical protein
MNYNLEEQPKLKPTVIWLQEALKDHLTPDQRASFEGLFQQALAQERLNIRAAFNDGYNDSLYVRYKNAHEYYDEYFES